MQNTLKERIRVLIGAMGDDEFERFMSDSLPRIYPGFEKLEPSFNFMGKTTKGKCDAYVYHSQDDTYTPIICTTRQSDIHNKVLEDINKLKSTKFSSKIRQVLLCINTPIKDEIESYRAACNVFGWELEPLSLERITLNTLGHPDLMQDYFGELSKLDSVSVTMPQMRRFSCGLRMKEAREDVSLRISELIEKIDFPSEREWEALETNQVDVAERYIKAISVLTGISSAWIKHNTSAKYPSESIYDFQFKKIELIVSENSLASYVVIEPTRMSLALIIQFTELNWKVFSFGFCMDFWNWIGDQQHIPDIFKLLTYVNEKLPNSQGRVITKKLMDELVSGLHHPAGLLKNAGSISYWFDDLFDIHHIYPIAKNQYKSHGEWFVKLQTEFRLSGIQEEITEIS